MITDNYIKMCEKAKKIQKTWKPTIGDYSFNDEIFIISKIQLDITTKMYRLDDINNFSSLFEMENILQDNFIWLPTQEQLQEMWWDKNSALHPKDLFRRFSLTLEIYADYFYIFLSPNELWLAFIMYEKWKKLWNGEDWIDWIIENREVNK